MDFDIIEINKNKPSLQFHKIFRYILYFLPLIIGLLFHIGKLFIYSQGPIHATDFETPLNPLYYFWNVLYPWHPLGLGSFASFNTFNLIYGIIATFSFNNALLCQILVLSLPPILGYIGIFLITRKILNLHILGCIFASFFYAFSPPYLAWFSLPYMLGFSLIPILLYLLIKLVMLCTYTGNISFGCIVGYSLGVSIILSILTSIYFHSFPFLILSLSLVCFFVLMAEKKQFNKKLFKRILIIASIIFVLYLSVGSLFKLQEINSIITDPEKQALILRTEDPNEIVNSFKEFYNESVLLNVIRLGGGTPNNERYTFFNNNSIGFILPFFVFIGILFFKRSTKRSVHIYLSCIINTLIIFLLVAFIREISIQNNYLLTNFLFSGVRRPERFLELLVVYYAIALAFSISGINCFFKNIKKLKIFNYYQLKKIIPVFLFVFLIIVQIFFVGLLSHPSDPINTQFYAPQPKDFDVVQEFLSNEKYETSLYNSNYRYMIIPSYVQMNVFTRYNNPNFFYVGSFSEKEVQEFVLTTNNMIASQNTNAIIPLSLASVKYICVLPESFEQDELQSWRLNGNTRSSGVYLFGDINSYRNFILEFNETTLISNNEAFIFENNGAFSRINVPTMLINSKGKMTDIFKGLKMIDSIIPLSNYSLIINQSENKTNQNFLINDLNSQSYYNVTIYNITDLNYSFDHKSDIDAITADSIIIWSENKSISTFGNYITLNGTIPEDKNSLSMWIKLSPTEIFELPFLKLKFLIPIEMKDNIIFQLLDAEGKKISATSDKKLSSTNGKQIQLNLTINPLNENISWLKVILSGLPGSSKEITLENQVTYEQVTGLRIVLDSNFNKSSKFIYESFPIMINSDINNTILWPTHKNEKIIDYIINQNFDLNTSILFSLSKSTNNTGWSKLDENFNWISPTSININLNLSLMNMENDSYIHIPIFFGNVYDESWNLHSTIEEVYDTEISHIIGNGYGNLWIVNISGISQDQKELQLSFVITYNSYQLQLYQKYTMVSIITILFIFPLYIIEIKYKKFKKNDHF